MQVQDLCKQRLDNRFHPLPQRAEWWKAYDFEAPTKNSFLTDDIVVLEDSGFLQL